MFEAGLIQELNLEATSTAVRKAAHLAKQALLDRADVLSTAKTINANAELSPELRSAAKRHELGKHLDKVRALDEAIVNAAEDIARLTPPIPPAETAGAASIDTELRSRYFSANEDQRKALLKDNAVQLALSRAPAVLTGVGDLMHASITDAVRRRLFPGPMAARDLNEQVLEAVKRAKFAHKETAKSTFGTAIETFATKITTAA